MLSFGSVHFFEESDYVCFLYISCISYFLYYLSAEPEINLVLTEFWLTSIYFKAFYFTKLSTYSAS